MTRSWTVANVQYEVMYKEEGKIVTDAMEDTLKCDTKEKAELILSKMHKKALVNILNIEFKTVKYFMSDEDFIAKATLVTE